MLACKLPFWLPLFATLCLITMQANADPAYLYLNGSFQYNNVRITGGTTGSCIEACEPWSYGFTFSLSFDAEVTNFQITTTCHQGCWTLMTGDIGEGIFTAQLYSGDPLQMYEMTDPKVSGHIEGLFCEGDCDPEYHETQLALFVNGYWDNGWYSNGWENIACWQDFGCNSGPGIGQIDTVTPEPLTITLLAAGIGTLGVIRRRKAGSSGTAHGAVS